MKTNLPYICNFLQGFRDKYVIKRVNFSNITIAINLGFYKYNAFHFVF